MAYYPATSFVPQFFSDPGVPLAGGSISAQVAGSSTATPMYLDSAGTSAGTSITLNARGEPQVSGNTIIIWLDSDVSYKFILKDASSVSKWTIDAISNPNFGLSDTSNPLLGDYLMGTHRTGTGAAAMRTHYWIETRTYNIKDFVDPTVTTTDWTAAINLAYARIPSTGGILEFPEGDFAFNTALSFTNAKPLVIKGQGQFATRLRPTFAGGDAITVNGPSLFGFTDIGIVPTVARTTGTYDLHLLNCLRAQFTNFYASNLTGGLFMIESSNYIQMSQGQGSSGDAATNVGDTCLRIKSAGGNYSNLYFVTNSPTGQYANSPPLWITGQSTSIKMANCGWAGGAPRSRWTVSGIVSGGANFTATTTATHNFQAGDYIVLRGMTPTAYNDMWRIASVGATTVVVTTTANPGTSTINGFAESVAACGFIDNEDGAVNESSISNTLFEATQANLHGTAGLYFDGRRGTPGSKPGLAGWDLDGNYYDFGANGLILSGTAANAGFDPTVSGISISGGDFSNNSRGILLDQVCGITINGAICHGVATLFADRIGHVFTQGLLIYAGPSAPFSQGITITNCNLGAPRGWQAASALTFNGGLALDGTGIQDLVVTGNNIYGTGIGIHELSTVMGADSRWKFDNNNLNYGTWPPTNTNVIPSVASATSISIFPYNEVQKITGTTTITGIAPGHIGQELTLIFVSALTLGTGGNLAIAANHNVLAGEAVNFYHDGTSWYLK